MLGLLGEVHFEELGGGRVRCVETGHEMPAVDKDWYGSSKKCRRALFDLLLAQQKSPMNVFEQSPVCRDKVICKLTGDTLNKTEEAIWKHMNGKKFQRKLAQKEAEKLMTVPNKEEALANILIQHTENQKLKKQVDFEFNKTDEDDSEAQGMDFEGPEFWVPPETIMEGIDPMHGENFSHEPGHLECINAEGDWEARISNGQIDGDEMAAQTKRKATGGPGRRAGQKKMRSSSNAKLSNE